MTHICVGNLTIIGSDNGLSPGRRQAITWTNVGILLIGPLGRNFSEMLIEIHTFSFKKIHLKMSSGKWRPFCLGLSVLKDTYVAPETYDLHISVVQSNNFLWFYAQIFYTWLSFPLTPAHTLRNNDVVITSKRRYFLRNYVKMKPFRRYNDVIITFGVTLA